MFTPVYCALSCSMRIQIGSNPLTTTGVMELLEAVAASHSPIVLLDCKVR